MNTASKPPPPGFTPLERTSAFRELTGPFFIRDDPQGATMGFWSDARHTNLGGNVHGGMIAVLADTALGYAIQRRYPPPQPMATTSLQVDYINGAPLGAWIEARVTVKKTGRRMAYASCDIWAGDRLLAQSNGAFLVRTRGERKGDGDTNAGS